MQFKRTLCLLACTAALAAVGLTGCSSTTHEPAELESIQELVHPVKVWNVSLGESANGFLIPAVTENAVYAAGGSSVYRLDPATGSKVWEADLKSDITAGVGTDGQLIAVGTADGDLVALDTNGKQLWKVRLSSGVNVPPLVGSGFVIVRTADTRVSAFNAQTGERRWHNQAQVPSLTVNVFNQMRFSPAGVLVGQSGGRLSAYDGQGKTVFDAMVALPRGITEVERLADVVGAPLVDQHMMCAAAFQGGVVCISAQNGKLIWRASVDAVTGPTSDGHNVYVVDAKGHVWAWEYDSGVKAWESGALQYRSPSALVPIGNTVATADYDGKVHFFDWRTGTIVGRTSISGDSTKVPPVQLGDGALFQTEDGELTYVKLAGSK